jgi:hypothetical protein
MSLNLPITWKDKVNSPELLAFLSQYGEENYLTAEEINLIRDAINEFHRDLKLVKVSKIYESGELQIFRKWGTTPDPDNLDPNVGDWCVGFVEGQFINAEYIVGNKLLLTSYNL